MSFLDRFKKGKPKAPVPSGTERKASKQASPRSEKDADEQIVSKASNAAVRKPKAEALVATLERKRTSEAASRLLIAPIVTEKTSHLVSLGKYVFEVSQTATKVAVRKAIEGAYGVHVTGVNMVRVLGKAVRFGRTSGREKNLKKAIVTLKKGEQLDVYGGV